MILAIMYHVMKTNLLKKYYLCIYIFLSYDIYTKNTPVDFRICVIVLPK